MEVGPDEAIVNLCKWPRKVFPSLAENCLPWVSASTLYIGAIILFAMGIVLLTRPYRLSGTRRQKMGIGFALICFSVVIGIWGLSFIASGDQTIRPEPIATGPEPKNPTQKTVSGVRKHVYEGLVKARNDLLQIKKDDLSCQTLADWQARADAATRLAHADGIGIHNPISQYLGSCQKITDTNVLNDIRAAVVQLLDQGIQASGG